MTFSDASEVHARPNDQGEGQSMPDLAGTLTLSPVTEQIVERIRNRFGVGLEVLDASLNPVVPSSGGDLHRAIEVSANTRRAIAAAMSAGRGRSVDAGGTVFLIQPLRVGRASRKVLGLLAARTVAGSEGEGAESWEPTQRWVDLLRDAIESDIAAAERLRDERLQGRRMLAVLRFLAHLATLQSESDIAAGVVHAAAVWFDVDARVYSRDLSGDLVLHTNLPGTPDVSASDRLSSLLIDDGPRMKRFTSTADIDGLRWAVPQALLVPIPVEGSAPWVLALGGVFTAEAETVFQTVAETMGLHLSRLAVARAADVKRRLESIAATPSRALELGAMDVLRQLMQETGAASGVVTLFDAGGSRRVAAVGSAAGVDTVPSAPLVASDQIVYPIAIGPDVHAVVELIPAADTVFGSDVRLAVREAASVLQRVLSGAVGRPAAAAADRLEPETADITGAFVTRITEELERAKRFDLGLSMLLIELAAQAVPAEILDAVIASVRKELRGSDVLGVVGAGRIAALLVHTDGAAVGVVLARVRQRLEQVLHGKELTAVRVGRGVFSQDCKTASDLLARASQDAVAVVPN
jgi:hypothetical protein